MCNDCNVNKTKIDHGDKEPSEDLLQTADRVPAAQGAGVPVQPGHGHCAALAEAGLGSDTLGLPRLLLSLLARGLHRTRRSTMTKLTRIMCTICFLGFCMSLMDSLLACCFAVNTSNMLLIVVSMMLFGCLLVMMNIFLQSCILSMLGVLLLFIGSACMLTDALGKSGRYL